MPLADHALILGINSYPGMEDDLQGPENDANDFYDWVTTTGGVLPANAKRFRSSDFGPPFARARDACPAHKQVHDFFIDVDEAAKANNTEGVGLRAGKRLWMFFAGHGFSPSLDTSGVLMADATPERILSIAAVLWADRIFQGGWFDEVILFQDACRERQTAANLLEPFFVKREASNPDGKRFYAFSSRDQKLSKELEFGGQVRGVFAVTLMEGLRGEARDQVTNAITARSLRTYLQDNMKSKLPVPDRTNPDIANAPDFRDPDMFDIVPAPPAAGAVATDQYRVVVKLPAANMKVTLQDAAFTPIRQVDPAPREFTVSLPRGIYRVVAEGAGERLFTVTGPGSGAGGAIDVSF